MEKLFGAGHSLSAWKPLSQPGQFASEERVTVVGPRDAIANVRVLGPVRPETQVEMAFSDLMRLGIKAVVRMETFSLCAAIYAADAAVKASEVRLLEVRLGRGLGGKSFVLLTGDVASAQAAIKAAESIEETRGLMSKSVVIPAPHPDLRKTLN